MHSDDVGCLFVLVQLKLCGLFCFGWCQHIPSGLLWCRISSSSLHHLLWRYCCINMDPLTKYLLSAQKLGASFQAFYLKCSNVSDQIIVSEGETQHREKSFESHLLVNFPAKTEALTRATSLPFRDNLCCSKNYSRWRLRIPFLLHRPLRQEHSFSSSLHPSLFFTAAFWNILSPGRSYLFFLSFLQLCVSFAS